MAIPVAIREKYGRKPGAKSQLVDHGGVLANVPVFKDPA
jgi:bifunctional DNA-binding transcriptional regulator/antitoxin component of YhaV-PrlF toxin-antitoxin module